MRERLRMEDLAASLDRLEAVIREIAVLTRRLEVKLRQEQPGYGGETRHV